MSGFDSFLRNSRSPASGLVIDPVSGDLNHMLIANTKRAHSKKKSGAAFDRMWDEETMLEKEGLLLAPGEGLCDESAIQYNFCAVPFQRSAICPLIGLPTGDIFSINLPLPLSQVAPATRPRPFIKSSDGASSEHVLFVSTLYLIIYSMYR